MTIAQKGTLLEIFTVVWMVIEAILAIYAGIVAKSVLLAAFGIDSVIEFISGGIILWRLLIEIKHGDGEKVERAEHVANWIVTVSLALLCLYILITSVYGLITHSQPESSLLGISVSAAAIIVMPLLAYGKKNVAKKIRSSALKGDIANTISCAYMAGTVLVGLLLNALFHLWWAENIAALIFLYWLFGETKAAFKEARENTHKQ